jgi:hypothetical protein
LTSEGSYYGWQDTEKEIAEIIDETKILLSRNENLVEVEKTYQFIKQLSFLRNKLRECLENSAFAGIGKKICEEGSGTVKEYEDAIDNKHEIGNHFSEYCTVIREQNVDRNFSDDQIKKFYLLFVLDKLQNQNNQHAFSDIVFFLNQYKREVTINLSTDEFNRIVEQNPKIRTGGYHVLMPDTEQNRLENLSALVQRVLPPFITITVEGKSLPDPFPSKVVNFKVEMHDC